jgi:hypothetical protein
LYITGSISRLAACRRVGVFALFFVFSRSPGCADSFNNLNYYKRAQLLRQLHEFNDGWLVSASTGGKQQASKRASEREAHSRAGKDVQFGNPLKPKKTVVNESSCVSETRSRAVNSKFMKLS